MKFRAILLAPQARAIFVVICLTVVLTLCGRMTIATGGAPLPSCVAPGTGSIDMAIAAPTRFDCVRPQAQFGPGTFWVRSSPIPDDRRSGMLRVRVGTTWQGQVTLYAQYADGRILAFDGERDDAAHRLWFRSTREIALPPRTVPLRQLFWHVTDTPNLRGIVVYPQILTATESENNELQTTALYVSFLGLCGGLLVFNIALWVAVRSRFQLAYCAMLATLGSYALAAWGPLAWVMPHDMFALNMRLGVLLLALNGIAGLWFTRNFFEPTVLEGWIDRAIVVVMALIAATAAAVTVLAPWHMTTLDRLHGATFGLQLALIGPILWRAWARQSMFRWMFVMVWIAPAMICWMRFSNTFHLMPTPFAMRGGTVLMLTIEALLSATAIAHRIHLLGRERDHARAQEIVARTLAEIDPLTGLLNRRAFLTRSIGRQGSHLLLLVDIDHFKHVNDTIGHDGGDEVLRVFARALRAAVPPDALVSRFGGEEFAIVVPADADLSAGDLLDRVRAERMPFDLRVTASIGTCIGALERESDWKALYREADRALFDAKTSGRDRIRTANQIARAA